MVDKADSGIDRPAQAASEARFGLPGLLGAGNRTLHFASLASVDGFPIGPAFAISTNADPPTLPEVDTVTVESVSNRTGEVGSIAENVKVCVLDHKIKPHIHIRLAVKVAEDMQADDEPVRIDLRKVFDFGLDLIFKVGTVLEAVSEGHTISEAFRPAHTGRGARCPLFQSDGEHRHPAPLALSDDGRTLAQLAVIGDRLDNLPLKRQLARLSVDRAGFRERRVTGLELHAVDDSIGGEGCKREKQKIRKRS